MAPVSGRDRGQLIVIGALAIAVSLVALALILNTGIYTHNLASRGHSAAGDGAEFAAQVDHGVGGVIEYANDEQAGATYADLVGSHYEPAVDHWSESAGAYAAADSRIVTVTPASDAEGVRIADDDPAGTNFHPAYGTPSTWTVAEDVKIRNYQGTIERDSTASATTSDIETLLSSTIGTLAFVVEFVDQSGTAWEVSLFVDSGTSQVTAMVQYPDGSYRTCTAPGANVPFDITAGLMGGEPCQAFAFVDEMDGPVDVRYHNGDKIEGQYAFVADGVVDGPSSEAGPFTHPVDVANGGYQCSAATYGTASSAGTGTPYVAPAIYTTDVRVNHHSPSASYDGRIRVAPGEPGTRPQAPTVTALTVTEPDTDANDGDFTVDWATRDPNGDSVDVSIEVAEDGGDDSTTATGLAASGTTTISVGDANANEIYTITVTVSDGTNSRSITVYHEDDGDSSGCPP